MTRSFALSVVLLLFAAGLHAQSKTPRVYSAQVNGTEVTAVEYEFGYWGRDTHWIPPKSYQTSRTMQFLPIARGPFLTFVPFSLIRRADRTGVVLSDGTTVPGLLYGGEKDGDRFEGFDRRLKGKTSLGDIAFPLSKVKTIVFHDDPAAAAAWPDSHNFASTSGLTATITPRVGQPVEVTNFEVFTTDDEGYYYQKSGKIALAIGDADNDVEVAKIEALRELKAKKDKDGYLNRVTGKLHAKSGESFDVSLKEPLSLYFGGTTPSGYVKIAASETKSVELK